MYRKSATEGWGRKRTFWKWKDLRIWNEEIKNVIREKGTRQKTLREQ